MQRQGRAIVLFLFAAALILFPTVSLTVKSAVQPMSDREVEKYRAYGLALPGAVDAAPTPEEILGYCVFAGEQRIGSETYAAYTSSELARYLKDCRELREVIVNASGTVYLTYSTDHNEMVILSCAEDGAETRTIYDETTDTAYFLSPDKNEKHTNYLKGESGIAWF